MSKLPEVDDLRLVSAIARVRSIGAAARELSVSQPSASQRLAAIERACGAVLFERDTTGARPTAAGAALAVQADHVLRHLEGLYVDARAVSGASPARVGAFAAIAASAFTGLDALYDRPVTPVIDHGPALLEAVGEGALDAAVVAIADQVPRARSLLLHRLGHDELVLMRPAGRERRAGRTPLRDERVFYTTYDGHGAVLHERLERLGAQVSAGATLATSLAMARWRDSLAVVPRSALAHDLHEDESIERLPFTSRIELTLVTGREPDPALLATLPRWARWMHLSRRAG